MIIEIPLFKWYKTTFRLRKYKGRIVLHWQQISLKRMESSIRKLSTHRHEYRNPRGINDLEAFLTQKYVDVSTFLVPIETITPSLVPLPHLRISGASSCAGSGCACASISCGIWGTRIVARHHTRTACACSTSEVLRTRSRNGGKSTLSNRARDCPPAKPRLISLSVIFSAWGIFIPQLSEPSSVAEASFCAATLSPLWFSAIIRRYKVWYR